MTYLTGFVPVAQGVACKVALERHADRPPSRGRRAQPEPDHGRQPWSSGSPVRPRADATPVEIALVMTDRMLLEDDHSPAHLDGYGASPRLAGPPDRA